MIILDFETNSHNPNDVVEVAAFKLELKNNQYEIVDTFHRYYFSKHPTNEFALAVHRLSHEVIMQKRKSSDYALFFDEDYDFVEFCEEAKTLVAHNITFELKHLQGIALFDQHICTMKQNKNIVGVLNKNGRIKNPKLIECCHFYDIEFDEASYHSALYDVSKTLEILNKMQH